MDPLEPKAISLCFFPKLVLRNNVRVVHNTHTSSPLPQRVVSAWSVPGGFATGNTSELAPSHQISLGHRGKTPLQRPACLILLGSPCPAAKLCSSLQIGCDSAAWGGNRGAVPQSSAVHV